MAKTLTVLDHISTVTKLKIFDVICVHSRKRKTDCY